MPSCLNLTLALACRINRFCARPGIYAKGVMTSVHCTENIPDHSFPVSPRSSSAPGVPASSPTDAPSPAAVRDARSVNSATHAAPRGPARPSGAARPPPRCKNATHSPEKPRRSAAHTGPVQHRLSSPKLQVLITFAKYTGAGPPCYTERRVFPIRDSCGLAHCATAGLG